MRAFSFSNRVIGALLGKMSNHAISRKSMGGILSVILSELFNCGHPDLGAERTQIYSVTGNSNDHLLWTAKDYREFLSLWLEQEKTKKPHVSLSSVARKLAMDSSLLGRILQGERHLATSRIQPVCDLTGLVGNQAEYFRHLVLHGKSKSAREAQACFERMQELRRIAPVPLDDAQESYWDKWIHVALRSLLVCGNFQDEWAALGNLLHPPQNPTAVKSAMKSLERMGMIAKDSDGFWRPVEPYVRDKQGSQTRALRNFHRQSILLALDALEKVPTSRRNISSVSVTLDEFGYQELVRMIEDLRGRALTRSSKILRPDRVVQLSLLLVPLAGRYLKTAPE
ncbi:MAG: TIGR02147 family protein [Fibrobacterota bacterium]|nr:MAG: TIGR02147 family protein [Fibrobacterota bacterium]